MIYSASTAGLHSPPTQDFWKLIWHMLGSPPLHFGSSHFAPQPHFLYATLHPRTGITDVNLKDAVFIGCVP